MLRIIRLVNLILLGVFLLFLGQVQAYNDGDFQIWNTDLQEIKLKPNFNLVLEQEFRWGNNSSEFYYQHYDAGLTYALNKIWLVGAGYRQIYQRSNVHTSWQAESAPYLFVTFSGDLFGFKFDDRNRLEYQYYSYQNDTGRYRNKLTIKAPWKITRLEIQPFVADEVFIMLGNAQGFNQNRLSGGFSFAPLKNLKAEIYYMLLSSKNSAGIWKDYNCLGTKIKISF